MTTLELRISVGLDILKNQIEISEEHLKRSETRLLYSQISAMRKSLDSLDNYLIAERDWKEKVIKHEPD